MRHGPWSKHCRLLSLGQLLSSKSYRHFTSHWTPKAAEGAVAQPWAACLPRPILLLQGPVALGKSPNLSKSVPTFYKQEAVTTSSATPLNWNEMGKNAKKEKVYGDANMIPLTAAAEQATQRSGPQELTGKVTGLLGVLKARISYAQARRQRKGLGGGREGKVNPSHPGGLTFGRSNSNSSEDHPPT